jgi:mannosyltransferase OCH1-like enzyme
VGPHETVGKSDDVARRVARGEVLVIPELLHQTAPTAELSAETHRYRVKLRELHPGWTYKLWTDEDNLAFVQTHFPSFYPVFLNLPRNIMRADVIRYLLMYKHGGLYLDTDYEMLKPFDLLEHDIILPWESDGDFGVGRDKIANAILASTPGHPFWELVIDELTDHPPLDEDVDVESSTGPVFLTRMYHRALRTGMVLCTPRRALFSPRTPRTRREREAILKEGVAYGIHHCAGTWRRYGARRRLRNRLAGLTHRVVGGFSR